MMCYLILLYFWFERYFNIFKYFNLNLKNDDSLTKKHVTEAVV